MAEVSEKYFCPQHYLAAFKFVEPGGGSPTSMAVPVAQPWWGILKDWFNLKAGGGLHEC